MKLDDRDIICETDYSPLSGEELVTQIEWHAAAMSGATAYDLERITGPARALLARAEVLEVAFANSHELNETLGNENRALLARAEAAEASRKALADRLGFEMEQRETLADRVAELEAQLAAQGWRPGSETPKHDWYLVYDFSEDDQPLFRYYGPAGWRLSGDRVIPNWYMPIPPLPPAPQEPE